MRRPLRRLAIVLALLALLGSAWMAVGEAAARRAAGVAWEATRDRRRQAELLPAGGALWAYQRAYAPLRAFGAGGAGAPPGGEAGGDEAGGNR